MIESNASLLSRIKILEDTVSTYKTLTKLIENDNNKLKREVKALKKEIQILKKEEIIEERNKKVIYLDEYFGHDTPTPAHPDRRPLF